MRFRPAQTLKIKKLLSFCEFMKEMLSFWSGLGVHEITLYDRVRVALSPNTLFVRVSHLRWASARPRHRCVCLMGLGRAVV